MKILVWAGICISLSTSQELQELRKTAFHVKLN